MLPAVPPPPIMNFLSGSIWEEYMAKKTFDFGTNPATQFISGIPLPGNSIPVAPQSGFSPQKPGPEKKDKRICVMIQSALYNDLSKIARVKGISKNEVFCRAAKEYRDNERRTLDRYKAIFEEQTECN
jgi:hypothetical protein